MDVDVEKRIKGFAENLRVYQAKAQAKSARDFIDRTSAAGEARANDAAGYLGFRKVSFPQRMFDRLSAFVDARGKLSSWCSPITAYETRLRVRVELARDAAKTAGRLERLETGRPPAINVVDVEYDFRENGKIITPADHLRAQIALKEGEKALRATEKDLQLTGLQQYSESMEADFKVVQADYDKWQKLLQRPAYFETVSFRFSPKKAEEAGGKSGGTEVGVLERWIGAAGRLIKRNFAVAIAPFEAYYAYGAFSLITPEDHKLALTASIIFATALGVLGSIAGNLYLRSWQHRVVKDRVVSRVHPRNAVLLGVTCLAAAGLVVGGADLRSKIPQAQQWALKHADLQDREAAAIASPLDTETDGAGRQDDVTSVSEQITLHDAERGQILRFDPRIDTSDEMIAYGIYLTVFLAAFGAWLFGRDPYNEYSLCAEALASVRRLRAEVAMIRDGIEHEAQSERSLHDQVILDLKARLWLLDRSDPIGLSPYTAASDRKTNADAGERPVATRTRGQASPAQATSYDHWLSDRVARFARWYVRFGGVIPDADKDAVKRTLETGVPA